MAAISLVGTNEPANPLRRRRFARLVGLIGLIGLVGLIGIAGVLRDAWPALPYWPPFNLHAAFGMTLWMLVVAQFLQESLAAPLTRDHALALSRRLSRLVYLLLYLVFGAQLILRIAVSYANSAPQEASIGLLSQPAETMRDYLAYGVIALIMIRALACARSAACAVPPAIAR